MFNFGKNKKNILLVLAALLVVITLFFFWQECGGDEKVEIAIKDKVFHVEVVSKRVDLEKGLGGRDGLCLNCGMFFKFSQPGKYAFWMKDMKFPIDIIWINAGEIVHLEKNVPPSLIGTLVSPYDADSVLEINAGTSDELKIKAGNKISF